MALHYSDANGGCGLPGVEEIPGESARSSWKESPEIVLSPRGLIKGRGKMVIFSTTKHNESDTNRKGSTKRRSERWFHLKRSYGCGVMRFRRLGTFCAKISSQTSP